MLIHIVSESLYFHIKCVVLNSCKTRNYCSSRLLHMSLHEVELFLDTSKPHADKQSLRPQSPLLIISTAHVYSFRASHWLLTFFLSADWLVGGILDCYWIVSLVSKFDWLVIQPNY